MTALARFAPRAVEPSRAVGVRPDHPALIEARSIFTGASVRTADSPRLLVSGENNTKLGKRVVKGECAGWPILQLSLEERATCPAYCQLWAGCYGNAMPYARRHRPDDDFLPRLDGELAQITRPTLIRLHGLGDFYSVEYVDFWAAALDRYPAVRVFGYTARNEADPVGAAVRRLAESRWPQFSIRYSGQTGRLGAVVLDRPADDPDTIMCPAQTRKTETCGTCGLCWSEAAQDKTIGFLRHGMKGAKVSEEPEELNKIADELWAKHEDADRAEDELIVMVWDALFGDNEDVRPDGETIADDVVALGAKWAIGQARIRATGSGFVGTRARSEAAPAGSGGGRHRGEYTPPPVKLLPEAMIVRWGASVAAGFNFMLPDGQRLGDCTRDELTKAAQTFSAFGKEAHQKSRWLLLIAQGLPQGQTVRQAYKPTRLTELAIEAEKNIEIPA